MVAWSLLELTAGSGAQMPERESHPAKSIKQSSATRAPEHLEKLEPPYVPVHPSPGQPKQPLQRGGPNDHSHMRV